MTLFVVHLEVKRYSRLILQLVILPSYPLVRICVKNRVLLRRNIPHLS